MARFVIFLLLLIPLAHVGLWLSEHPGSFGFTWLGWQVEVSMAFLAVALALVALCCVIIGMAVWAISHWPKQRALKQELARTKRGLAQLNTALIATRSQDYGPAQRALLKAGKLLPDSPLPHLVGLQLSVRHGEESDTRTHLSALRAHDDTAHLALQQLVRDALARNAYDEAEGLLLEAQDTHPRALWVQQERVRLAVRTGNFGALIEELGRVSFKHAMPAQARKTLRAQLYHLDGEYAKALQLDAGFVPAAIARATSGALEGEAAIAVLLGTWKLTPCKPLLQALLHISETLPETKQRKIAKRFAAAVKGHAEAEDVLAAMLLRLGAHDEALAHAKAAMTKAATPERFERIAAVLAARDGAEAANPWLKQALDAPHHEGWICSQCGSIHSVWAMECSHCHALGTMAWGQQERLLSELLPASNSTDISAA